MMRSVYLKTLYDKRYFVLGWFIGFTALAMLMTSFYPAMRQDGSFDALVQSMPAAFQGLIGNLSNLKSFDTYLAAQLFDIRMPLIAGIMAIILGLGLSVSEEEKGELRTILSLPVSRLKAHLQTWLAMVTILFVVNLGAVVGVYSILPIVDGATIEFSQILRLSTMTLLVMITFATIPYAFGRAFGKRSVANSIAILVVIGSFLLSTFGKAVDWLGDYEKLSLLHYFPAVDIVKNGIDLQDVFVYVVLVALLLVGSIVLFRRRDIA